MLQLRATYHALEDEQHHSSHDLDEEDDQHDAEELNGEKNEKWLNRPEEGTFKQFSSTLQALC